MKKHLLHISIGILLLCAIALQSVTAEGLRIVPRSVTVSNDSLRLTIEMDLNSVRVNSLTAIIFTPELKRIQGKGAALQLPPVVITGSKRFRYERRERALAATGGEPSPIPYIILLDNKQTRSKQIRYRVAVPYASWMQQARLLLRQELKDCCDLQLLGVDTLSRKLTLTGAPAATTEESLAMQTPQPEANGPRATRVVTPLSVPTRTVSPRTGAVRTAPASNRTTAPAATRLLAAPTVEHIDIPLTELDTYASMVSFLTPVAGEGGKQRMKSAVLYIDYPLGKDEVYPDYKNNRREIDKVDESLLPVLAGSYSELQRVRIRGYASPDGPYRDNERLASARSRLFARYVQRAYDIPAARFDVSSVAEDWDGLEELLDRTQPPYREAALDVIRRYGVFDGREKHLMDLQGGAPYNDMLKHLFPKLRRIEIVVEYNVRALAPGEAGEMLYTRPDLLSLEEMFAVARYYRPGTEQYREVYEVAAFHFPDDVVANVNAASAVMLTGDLISAWEYLRKVEADPRAWNNIGVLTLLEGNPEGAAVWFRKAVGVEPGKARRNLQRTIN